jgi:prepilin-type N-terminal cleavage/methylation domain-containing protein
VTRSRGFTLLESLVALAVTAAVVVILQRAVADALRARRTLAADVERRGGVGAVLVHLVHELGGAVPGTLRIEPATAEQASLLEFAIEEPAPLVVRYRVVADRLERAVRPRFAAGDSPDEPAVMLPDVAALTVRGRDTTGWHERWEVTRPPALVSLELALTSGEQVETVVPIVAGVRQ